MNIRIGVMRTQKELEIELPEDTDVEHLKNDIQTSLRKSDVLWLTDSRGRLLGIPTANVAYVEMDPQGAGRSIGFGS